MANTFSERLREAMNAKGMTQSNLARHCNVSQATVWAWLNSSEPRLRHVKSLTDLFGRALLDGDCTTRSVSAEALPGVAS
jgi:transcriptional regulator with XRE-family HTH domain